VSVVSISSNTIVNTITLGIQPSGIAITPDGSYAYVSNYSTVYNGMSFTDLTSSQGPVDIISLPTNTVIPPIIGGLGFAPDAIAISPNGQFAYVTNYSSNTVSVIALPSTLYNINRLTQPYNLQLDDTITKLNKAGQ
jgi:DNA-binding beta-propeller fold protein YncE